MTALLEPTLNRRARRYAVGYVTEVVGNQPPIPHSPPRKGDAQAPLKPIGVILSLPIENQREGWADLSKLDKLIALDQLLSGVLDPDRNPQKAAEVIDFIRARPLGLDHPHIDQMIEELYASLSRRRLAAALVLAQCFEGTVIEADDDGVTVEFDIDDRRELRRFARDELGQADVHVRDAVQLRCLLTLDSPTPPLSEAQIELWMRSRPYCDVADEQVRRSRSLEEDEL